jgi:hypothetical protein
MTGMKDIRDFAAFAYEDNETQSNILSSVLPNFDRKSGGSLGE